MKQQPNPPIRPTPRKQTPDRQNAGNASPHRNQRPLPLSRRDRISIFLRQHLHVPTLRPDGELIAKIAVCAVLLTLLALLQTTVFARFRPFGAIPDLMLAFTVAIALTEGERFGAVCGLIAAFIIESLGSGSVSLLPLLYMPAGYFCPIITRLYLTDSLPVRLIYTAVCTLARVLITLFYLALTVPRFDLPVILGDIILPEYASTFLMSLPVHALVRLLLHPFHKSRSERVGTL